MIDFENVYVQDFQEKFGYMFLHAVDGYLCYSLDEKTYTIQDDDIKNIVELCEKSLKENKDYVLEYFKKNGNLEKYEKDIII